jgi:SAM-dependent methyltransferase
MDRTFNEYFHEKGFQYRQGLFYQDQLDTNDFEIEYINLRKQEGRMYDDDLVMNLPRISKNHPLHHEWKVREASAKELVGYLKKRKIKKVLEVGCGNGWMTNYFFRSLGVACCGIDINKTELEQATRLFKNKSNEEMITFAYGDVLSPRLNDPITDIVVLASVIQYFPHLTTLLSKLRRLTKPNGEIHILDSPLYENESDLADAKKRSYNYFSNLEHSNMKNHYYHHTWNCLKDVKFDLLHNPMSVTGRVKRLLTNRSPFPWIKVYT